MSRPSRRNRATTVCFHAFSGFRVRVILATDLQRTGRRLGADLTGAAAAWITRSDQPEHGWLVLTDSPDAATIAHESSHAVRSLFRHAGAKVDDEAFAYHLDHLVGRIHKFIERGNR